MKCNGYLTIIDSWGMEPFHSFVVVCMGSPVIIIIYKKVSKQVYTQKLEFSTRVGTIVH